MREKIVVRLPVVLVCEGQSDQRFLERLVRREGLDIQVIAPTGENVGGGGIQRIPDLLTALGVSDGWNMVRHLGLAVDADSDPLGQRGRVESWLRTIRIESSCYLLPNNQSSGTLEDLLLDCIRANHPEMLECASQFANCMGSDAWEAGPKSKMLVHSIMASSCVEEPATNLAYCWGKKGCPLDISSGAFDSLAEYLKGL